MYLTIVYILDIYKIPYLKKREKNKKKEEEAPITMTVFISGSGQNMFQKSK